MSPYIVAVVVVLVLPALWWSSSGTRLAMHDGDLVLTRYWLGGERIVGKIDGGVGRWWITYADGRTEQYAWEHAPAVIKVSPKLSPTN